MHQADYWDNSLQRDAAIDFYKGRQGRDYFSGKQYASGSAEYGNGPFGGEQFSLNRPLSGDGDGNEGSAVTE